MKRLAVSVATLSALAGAAWADAPYSGQPPRTGSMYNGANVSHARPSSVATAQGQTMQEQTTGGAAGGGEQLGGEH